MANIGDIVEKTFDSNEEKEKFLLFFKSNDLVLILNIARDMGFNPKNFSQTYMEEQDAHIRLTMRYRNVVARITSEFIEDNNYSYELYIPYNYLKRHRIVSDRFK